MLNKITWEYSGNPPLATRKVLCGRLIAAKACCEMVFRAFDDTTALPEQSRIAERIFDFLSAPYADDDSVSIEKFVTTGFEHLQNTAPVAAKARVQDLTANFISRLDDDCSIHRPEDMCDLDHPCADQLSMMITNVCLAAEQAYADAFDGASNLPDISINVHVGDMSLRIADGNPFYARTRKDSENDQPKLAISFGLAPHLMKLEQFLQIPALLFHEIFVHVFQGVTGFCARPKTCGPFCIFTEGIMDAVGIRILRHSFTTDTWTYTHSSYSQELSLAYRDEASNWHNQRLSPIQNSKNLSHIGVKGVSRLWKDGADALQSLEDVFISWGTNTRNLHEALMYLNAHISSKQDLELLNHVFGGLHRTIRKTALLGTAMALDDLRNKKDLSQFFASLEEVKKIMANQD